MQCACCGRDLDNRGMVVDGELAFAEYECPAPPSECGVTGAMVYPDAGAVSPKPMGAAFVGHAPPRQPDPPGSQPVRVDGGNP